MTGGIAAGVDVASGTGAGLKLELGYAGGLARLAEWRGRGGGGILRFQRVRPPRDENFQPLRSTEITPQFLDRAIRALRRWNYEIISIDDVCARIERPDPSQRFVCLTFDGASRDLMAFGYPVLARHRVPFTVYLPTAFPDGFGEAWWLALEQVVARHGRLALLIGNAERRFDTARIADKHRTFDYLARRLRSLPPAEMSVAIKDLCKRYGVDLATTTREAFMDWDEIGTLAADPNVTFGSATVNYPMLAQLDGPAARREIAMGRAVAEAAFGRALPHFAYPYGDRDAFEDSHIRMVEDAGFASAVTTQAGVIAKGKLARRHALPRIDWDGRRPLRAMRVMLSGW